MSTSSSHNDPTIRSRKEEIPIYYSDQLIPEKFRHKTIAFKNKLLAITFTRINNQLISLPFTPWGSFFRYSAVDFKDFQDIVYQMIGYSKKNGCNTIVIKHPPKIYNHSVPNDWLVRLGFESNNEINQHLDLQQKVELHQMEKRKLKKLLEDYSVQKQQEVASGYELIKEWREKTTIPLNIEKNHLLGLFSKLPTLYDYWSVKKNHHIAAVCICIKVTPSIVYYFLPATNPSFRSDSPMVLLLQELCSYYHQEGFNVLDLGQSSIDGIPQEGLFQFKERMGAISTEKTTFRLDL